MDSDRTIHWITAAGVIGSDRTSGTFYNMPATPQSFVPSEVVCMSAPWNSRPASCALLSSSTSRAARPQFFFRLLPVESRCRLAWAMVLAYFLVSYLA